MDHSPDAYDTNAQHSEDPFSQSSWSPGQARALPQAASDWTPDLASRALSGTSREVLSLRTTSTQKFFSALALLLTTLIVLAIPFLVLKQSFFPNQAASPAMHAPLLNLNATALARARVIPEPPGRAIQPLAQQILTGASISGDFTTVEQFEKDAGRKVSVLLFYQPWGGTEGEQDFPAAWASSVRQHGSLPLITWEPWIPRSYPADVDEASYALQNIIAGKFDHYIVKWAIDAKIWKAPFFLRFAPEMNGDWTPWSQGRNGNTAGEFVQAWRHVHDLFVLAGVTNATWMWCPNIDFPTSLALSELYPGDAYVDWTGMDGFNWGTTRKYSSWLTFSQVFRATYADILSITTKPMMIAETGSVEQGGDEAAWIINAYAALPHDFPDVKGIVWFNQVTQEDWRIEVSPATRAAFFTAMQSSLYASNVFADAMGG